MDANDPMRSAENLDALYESWVASLQRDKERLARRAGVATYAAVVAVLVTVLALVALWAAHRGAHAGAELEEGEEGQDQ